MLTLARHTELQAVPPNPGDPTAVLPESLFLSPAKWWPCGISCFMYCVGVLPWRARRSNIKHKAEPGLYHADLHGANLVKGGASNSVPYVFIGHLQVDSILVQLLQHQDEERLSSTESKSSQFDSDHKQGCLYSWDSWEMSLIWPQTSKASKSAWWRNFGILSHSSQIMNSKTKRCQSWNSIANADAP